MKSQRTCDRCYKIKARCLYESKSGTCARCARLGHTCETRRAILQPGRPRRKVYSQQASPPRHQTPGTPTASPDGDLLTSDTQLIPFLKDFKKHEILLVEFTLHPDQIAGLIYGQTFHRSMQEAIAGQLFSATDLVKDGFLAFAGALLENKNIPISGLNEPRHAIDSAKALAKLSHLGMTSVDNARIALALALMLVTYNDLCVGATTLPISRSALLHVAPYQHQLIRSTTQDTDPNIICLLFVEMSECLVRGQIPIFRCDFPRNNTVVDRYYGICHELLPILYDICVLFNLIKAGEISTQERALQVECMALLVEYWDPDLTIHMRDAVVVDKAEQYHFLLQARAFKTAVQLLLIQAQGIYGSNILAHSKAKQLEAQIYEAMSQGINRPKYLLFPYFIGSLELYNATAEAQNDVLANMNEICNGLAPMACQSMMACLRHIWRNRQRRPELPWFECVNEGLAFGMGP